MPRTLITGGAGFLGSHLCDRFVAEGHEVICMDNLLTGTTQNIAHLRAKPHFHFIEHDVTTYIEVDGPLDYVLHFASPASPIDYLRLPIQTLKVGAPKRHAFCWPPPAKSTATPNNTRNPKPTGATSTR